MKCSTVMTWRLGCFVAFVVSNFCTTSARASLSDCIDATCRITAADGSRGTGCVFEIGQGRVYVLTAAHVVGSGQTVQCEFWRHGHRSQPLAGRVSARVENDDCDVAVVALQESQFGGVVPKAVPVAPRDYVVHPGATLTSVGCAKGSWSTGWKGHALGYRGADLHFTPTPADGRSGSAIFDAGGTMIVGLLRARTLNDSEGIACSLQSLYKHLSTSSSEANTQCPPGGCPLPKPYALPYRYREQFRNQSPSQPQIWPTLPSPTPATPPADLSTTNERLDTIADLLLQLKVGRQPPEIPAPVVPGPSPEKQALDAAAEANAAATAAQQENSKLRELVDKAIGDRETLRDRFDARIAKVKEELGEDAGKRQIARAYVKDLAAEKLSGGAGWSMGKLLGGALGVSAPLALGIGLAGFFLSRRISHKIDTGEPLLVQRLFDRLGDKIDNLKDRLHDEKTPKKR